MLIASYTLFGPYILPPRAWVDAECDRQALSEGFKSLSREINALADLRPHAEAAQTSKDACIFDLMVFYESAKRTKKMADEVDVMYSACARRTLTPRANFYIL